MKNIFTILIFCFSFLSVGSIAAQTHFDNLKNRNYTAIANKMAPKVNVQINRKKKLVSKEKAIQMLRTRLEEFNPIEWKLLHRGESEAENGRYMIAALTNEAGEGIRLFIQVEKSTNGPQISSVRIRKAL